MSTQYEAVIGLEVHCQVLTASKMFCTCPNEFGAEPNTNVCPVCMGHPGVMPVPNKDAIRKAGGATEKANLDDINLAAKLRDGEEIVIPAKEMMSSINGAVTVNLCR